MSELWSGTHKSDEESDLTVEPSEFAGPNYVQAGASDSEDETAEISEMDEISEIESIVSIKANPTVTEEKKFMEKTVNKKLGAGLADVLFSLGDDDLDTLNDDCKYSYDMDHLIWTKLY